MSDDQKQRAGATPRNKAAVSPLALAVIVGIFVVAVIGFVLANPGGPGAESGGDGKRSPPEESAPRQP